MSCVDVELDTPELRASVRTTFLRPEPSSASEPERPLVLFLHGADFSCLEWRLVMRPLLEAGIDCVALDWYSGGWTDRLPLNARLRRAADALPEEYQKGGGEVTPWAIVRQHLQAFWAQELEGRQLVVVSRSTVVLLIAHTALLLDYIRLQARCARGRVAGRRGRARLCHNPPRGRIQADPHRRRRRVFQGTAARHRGFARCTSARR